MISLISRQQKKALHKVQWGFFAQGYEQRSTTLSTFALASGILSSYAPVGRSAIEMMIDSELI
jgi:hypothetical protein